MSERGIALLAGLVLLAAISLLALVATSGMFLQRRMAVNFQENSLALENANIAQSYAKAWLNSRVDHERERGCESDCLLPVGITNSGVIPAHPEFESVSWWRANAVPAGWNPDTGEAVAEMDPGGNTAYWLMEEIHYEAIGDASGEGAAEGVATYRILSRGTGRNSGNVAVTESIVARPWEGAFTVTPFPLEGSSMEFCRQFGDKYDCGSLAWRQRR